MTTRCFQRAIQGDPSATAELVEMLRPRIAKMAAYYARCTGEDADDLLQEAWLGLLEALPHLDLSIGSPDQHLIQRAKWRLLDAVKRARVRRCASLEECPSETAAGVEESPIAAACVSDFSRNLKERQRAVLACLLAGLTWREAGHALGCSAANIAYHVRQIQRQYEAWNESAEEVAAG